MVSHIESIIVALDGVAYNYHWDMEYIKTSFNLKEVSRLLDSAALFNPWISKKKDQDSESIPEDEYIKRRKEFEEQRKEWEQSAKRS